MTILWQRLRPKLQTPAYSAPGQTFDEVNAQATRSAFLRYQLGLDFLLCNACF